MTKPSLRVSSRNIFSMKNPSGRMTRESLDWLREYRRQKVANRALPHQPKAA